MFLIQIQQLLMLNLSCFACTITNNIIQIQQLLMLNASWHADMVYSHNIQIQQLLMLNMIPVKLELEVGGYSNTTIVNVK